MAFGSAAVTLTDANTRTNPVTYGPVGPNFLTNIPLPTQTTACDQTHPCDETPLTVNLSPANLVNMRVTVQVQWPNHEADSDFDLYVFRGGTEIARDAGVFDPEIASFNAVNGSNYNIRVVIFDPQGESFTVKVFYEPIPSPNPAPTGPSARFQVYPAPSSVSSVAAAALEPSIGVNWNTGVVATQCDIHTLFTTFDDCSSPASDTWVQRDADNTAIDFDPILFTDIFTGRTFNSLLVTDPVAFTTGCSEANQTDDDGFTWVAQDGCSKPGGSDHQSLGGGPYHAPLIGTPAYPNAVYYCAQDPGATLTAPAFCARSDDGGLTFGPAVAAYTVECFGLHGHIKVGPDGTVFLPVRYCSAGGFAGDGFAYSEDNGTTWKVSVVPGSSRSASDPSVGIGLNNVGKPVGQASNTVYLGYCDGNGHPMVAVSHDLGTTYVNVFDVGVSKGLQNCAFPDMVAGDDNRGMLYFLGSTTGGDFQPSSFAGEWHAYVASTYDGGATWGLTDVTPTQPVQIGCIWLQGGSNACRNLLDFNA
jgi:hypothetical protein